MSEEGLLRKLRKVVDFVFFPVGVFCLNPIKKEGIITAADFRIWYRLVYMILLCWRYCKWK